MNPSLCGKRSPRPVSPRSGPGHPTGQGEIIRRVDRSHNRRRCPSGDTGEANPDHNSTLMFRARGLGRYINLLPQRGVPASRRGCNTQGSREGV